MANRSHDPRRLHKTHKPRPLRRSVKRLLHKPPQAEDSRVPQHEKQDRLLPRKPRVVSRNIRVDAQKRLQRRSEASQKNIQPLSQKQEQRKTKITPPLFYY